MATKASSIIFSHWDTHIPDEKMLFVMPLNKKNYKILFLLRLIHRNLITRPFLYNCDRGPDSCDWLSLIKTHLLSLVKCPASSEDCESPQTKSGFLHKEVWERMANGQSKEFFRFLIMLRIIFHVCNYLATEWYKSLLWAWLIYISVMRQGCGITTISYPWFGLNQISIEKLMQQHKSSASLTIHRFYKSLHSSLISKTI